MQTVNQDLTAVESMKYANTNGSITTHEPSLDSLERHLISLQIRREDRAAEIQEEDRLGDFECRRKFNEAQERATQINALWDERTTRQEAVQLEMIKNQEVAISLLEKILEAIRHANR